MIQIGLNCSPQQPIARRSWGSTSLRYKHALSSASLLGGSPLTLAFPSCSPPKHRITTLSIFNQLRSERGEDKELSRAYRRTVFTHTDWETHRSTSRYFRHVDGMLTSRIVRGLLGPLLYVGSICVTVCIYESLLRDGTLDQLFPQIPFPHITTSPMGPFSISTFAMSLLLVFRTNSSYDRWVEARRIWGNVVNRCRDLTRQGTLWIPEEDEAHRQMLARLATIFPVALMCHLRVNQPLEQELKERGLDYGPEYKSLISAPHVPIHVLLSIASCLRSSSMRDSEMVRMDEGISALHDAIGGCERIFKTPIPLSYTRHTSRFLVLWLTSMPFCIYDQLGISTTPVALAMAFLLLGIDEIGVQLEEPFSIMALESMCDTVKKNVEQTLAGGEEMRKEMAGVLGNGNGRRSPTTGVYNDH